MRPFLFHLLLLATVCVSTVLADESGAVTRTFYVTGVECGACVYLVQLSASECKGVIKADVVQTADSFANVTFNPRLVSEHQIAQAIRDAMPVHGTPYLARLKVHVDGYSNHATDLGALFQKWRQWVQCEVLDAGKGELVVHFLPLQFNASHSGPAGWSVSAFQMALRRALPSGVRVECVEEKTP
jgi:copper chaperone CopZ